MAACVGILSHLQTCLEPFGSGSALRCSGEANILVAFSLQDLQANFMGPGVIGACLHCRNLEQLFTGTFTGPKQDQSVETWSRRRKSSCQ